MRKFRIYATCLRTGATNSCGILISDESGPINTFLSLIMVQENEDYQFELVEIEYEGL